LTWQNTLLKANELEKFNDQGLQNSFGVYVSTVSSDTEIATVSYYGNKNRPLPVPHPFVSSGSWFRAMPENGASYIAQMRDDESDPQMITSVQRQSYKRVESYRKGVGLYRPLQPGELETSSSGLAQTFWARRALFEHRAGILLRSADQDTLSVYDRAPIHVKQFFNYKSGELGDEQRTGIVARPANTWQFNYIKAGGGYAAEDYISMKNPGGSSPAVLFSRQRGHVINGSGGQILQTVTQVPLRFQEVLYANDESFTSFEVDEKGNYLIKLAEAATEGMEVQIPQGNFKLFINKDYIETVTGNKEVSIKQTLSHVIDGNMTSRVKGDIKMQTLGGKVVIGSSAVELLDIVSTLLDFLSKETPAGFGAPLIYFTQYLLLKTKLDTIKGSF